jgi:hypothetical protein
MSKSHSQWKTFSFPKHGKRIHTGKPLVCQKHGKRIHTGKPLVCQIMESTFTLKCHMFNKTWKAVFFCTRENLPKSEIKIRKKNTDGNHIHTGKPLVRQNMEITFTRESRMCKTCKPTCFFSREIGVKKRN